MRSFKAAACPLLAAVLFSAGACGGGDAGAPPTTPVTPPQVLSTVTVSLNATSLQIGESGTATATGADQAGKAMSLGTVSWTSSSPAVASVSPTGAISALAIGTTTITATSGSVNGSATLTVTAFAVVTLTAPPPSVALGDAFQLTATVRDQAHAVVTNPAITWTSSDTTRALVSPSGLVVTRGSGAATITAAVADGSAQSTFTVRAAPAATSCKLPAFYTSVGLGFPKIANRLRSTGTVRLAVIFVDFPDAPATVSPQAVLASLSPSSTTFYNAISYGNLNVVFDVNPTWFRMSKPTSQYGWAGLTNALHKAYVQEAAALADPTTNFSTADAIVVMAPPTVPNITNGPTLILNVGQGITLDGKSFENAITSGADLNAWPAGGWLTHETGHMMGLVDLYDYAPGSLSLHHFVGSFSRMGHISSKAPGYLAWERWLLGWLGDDQMYCAPGGTGMVGLAPIATPGGTKAIVLPTGATSAVVAEYRTATAEDAALGTGGVLVYTLDTSIPTGAGVVKVQPIADSDALKTSLLITNGGSLSVGGYTIRFVGTVADRAVVQVTKP